MFAFAVWDGQERTLRLARDAMGIKPLYYGWQGGCFLFGSELKALRAYPGFEAEIDREALALFLRHNYVPAPRSIYRGIYKLPAGSALAVSPQSLRPAPQFWWDLRQTAQEAAARPLQGSDHEAADALDHRLREAVALQMEADVPLGAFLSGGIDSSTVVAMMQAQTSRPVETFTIGFEEAGYSEAAQAKAVARHLGTRHTEYYVTAEQTREQIPRLPAVYDEPFADSSQIPTMVLCGLARQKVTVCLSGDGGDELFCGYDRYFYLERLWRRMAWCPGWLRKAGATVAQAVARAACSGRPARRLHTLGEMLSAASGAEFYARFNTHWRNPARVVLGAEESPMLPAASSAWPDRRSLLEQMMCLDAATYLPDDLLVKVDRASMAVGLEVRVPLLDHRLAAFAWSLPLEMKVRRGQTKWLLRRVLERYVPRALIDRPKMGFGVPLDAWLRGPLREWAEALLAERRLRDQGFFHPEPIRQKWNEHLSGRHNWQYLLWDVLVFQAWFEASRSGEPSRT
jgi:asparagine synthase (glutamine-hydrolysing)